MRKFTKSLLTLALLVFAVGGAKARTVKALGSPITFEQALVAESGSFVLVQDGKVLCGPTSPSDNSLTYKNVSEIDDYAYSIHFEEDGTSGKYFMALYDQAATPVLKGYINGAVWSHTYLSDIDKGGSKGERQDGALWSITETGSGTKVYTIKNVGVVEGNYNVNPNTGDPLERDGQGFLACTTAGYWTNHVTMYNTSGTWQFYTLTTTTLPDLDPVYFGWDDFVVDGGASKDDENHLVIDTRGYAPYWATSGTWTFATPFDASNYRYLVFFAKRNISKYGNGDNETGGSLLIKDDNGITMRQDDYSKYGDPAVDYPGVPSGGFWMNRWGAQRAMALDLQWLANTDKYGNGSECKAIDITKIKQVGVAGTFTIGGIFFTNTLPAYLAGDYTRSFDSFDKFGTICLPYNAVCCGAQLYEITGKTANSITLSEYEGVMEAGKPYFYKTLEANKQDGGIVDETNVFFFKAGYATASAGTNNGLVGTFSQITLDPNDDYYVLATKGDGTQALFKVDAGATGEKAVKVGANKAYVDLSAITPSPAPEFGLITLDIFGNSETTGVNDVRSKMADVRGEVYNLNGQRVAQPTKGLYIVNGKTMVIK